MDGQAKIGTWRTIRRLEKSIPQVRWHRGELILMSLFVNIFALGLPIFILQVYDRILPNLGLTTMQFLVIGLVIVMILDFILKSIRAAITTYTGARFEHLARVAAVDKILRTPQDVYEQETPGAYLDKVNAIGVVKEFYSSQLGTLFIDLPFAVFFLGMIWFLGGLMVAVPIGLLTMFGIMAVVVGGNLRRAVDVRGQVDNRRYDFLIEIINGIHTVKAQAFKNLLQRQFEGLQETSARAVRSVAMQSSIAQSLGSTFGQLNMACVIGLGAVLVINGQLSAGELAACTLLSGRAMQPLQSAMGLWTNFQTIRVACVNATSLMELPAEDLGAKPEIPKIVGEIKFRDVTFGYAGMEAPLIKNLNLHFKAGSMIGLEGDNSSGRSTLLKLMIGIIRPSSGQVMIDGHDISQHQSHSYREQMAFLSADSNVYTGSILDNMTYFRGGRYIKKAMDLSKKLDLDEEIKRLPEGYGTHIGDGAGGVLPAGFAQRITVVRAMVDDPKIVLFDNANDGLDSNTDKILLDYLISLRGRATVILVSARPSWLRVADTRYAMSHGDVQLKVDNEPARSDKPTAELPAPTPAPAVSKATTKPAASQLETPAAPSNAKQQSTLQLPSRTQLQAKPAASKSVTRKDTPPPKPAPVAAPAAARPAQRLARPVQATPAPRQRSAVAPKLAPTQNRKTSPQRPSVQRPAVKKVAPRSAARPQSKPTPIAQDTIKRPTPSTIQPTAKTDSQPITKNGPPVAAKSATRPPATKKTPREPATRPVTKPVTSPISKTETRPVASPVARPASNQVASSNTVKPAVLPQARPVTAPRTSPVTNQNQPAPRDTKASPQPAVNAKPAARPIARPVARPTARPATNQRAATTALKPTATQSSSAAPKPVATLRPATPAPKKSVPVIRPQPPKPRRINPHDTALGGTE